MKRRSARLKKQMPLQSQGWGGVRAGAGRPRGENPQVRHREREAVSAKYPMHITVRLKDGLPTLRSKKSFAVFQAAAVGATAKGLRVLQYAILGNHFHLLVEADDNRSLANGMRSLNIRLTKGLNKLVGASASPKGSVFVDRYHMKRLTSPRQVRNALVYIFTNAAKHFNRKRVWDWYSSFALFKEARLISEASSPRYDAGGAAKKDSLGKRKSRPPRFDWTPQVLTPKQRDAIVQVLSTPESWLASIGWQKAVSVG